MIRDFGDKTKEVLDIWSRIKGDNLGVGITILIFIAVYCACVFFQTAVEA